MNSKFTKLYNIVMESLLKENSFSGSDFSKHDFKYVKAIISKILNNKTIKIGAKGDTSVLIELNEDDKNLLNSMLEHDPEIGDFNTFLKSKSNGKITWTKIFKGQVTGYEDNRQSTGEKAEPYVCYCFNNSNFDLEKLNEFSNDWQLSITNAADVLKSKFNNEEYYASHVNNKNIDEFNDPIVIKINNLFSGKFNTFNEKLTDVPKTFKQKDNWCKADIVLIKIDALSLIENSLKDINDFNILNDTLNQLIESNNIIPVSLKKLPTKKEDIHFYFVNKENEDDFTIKLINNIESIYFQEKKKSKNENDTNASCYLKSDNGLSIQFRRQSSGNNISIEVGGKNARGGKCWTMLQDDLNIKQSDFYIFKDENDYKEKLNSINIEVKDLSNYKYISYQGIYSIFIKYKEKYGSDKTLIDFFKYCYLKGAGYENKVNFWILK